MGTSTNQDPFAAAEPDEVDGESVDMTEITEGTFTLDQLSFEQVNYDPSDRFEAGVQAPPDEIKSKWEHKFYNGDDITEYRGPDMLTAKVKSILNPYNAERTDRRPRRRFVGPTGSGKTTFAKHVAYQLADADPNWPFDASYPVFDVTMSHITSQAKLIGHPSMSEDGNDTDYILGPLPKALLVSQLCPTVLYLDEVNRSTIKDALYEVIDGRTQVRIDGIGGGLVIQGNAYNLIVVSAMNAGPGYKTEPLDFAENRRLGSVSFIDYLAEIDDEYDNWDGREAEINLIDDLTPASRETVKRIFQAGENIRAMAKEGDARIKPIPTGSLIAWAKIAHDYYMDGVPNALFEAGKDVVNGLYDGTRTFSNRQDSPLETVKTSKITDVKAVDYEPESDSEKDAGANNPGATDTSTDAVENSDGGNLTDIPGIGQGKAEALRSAGYNSPEEVREAVSAGTSIADINGIGEKTAKQIESSVRNSPESTEGESTTDTSTNAASDSTTSGSDNGNDIIVKCEAHCGFKLPKKTADKYKMDPNTRPNDANDYERLKVKRCPNCAQTIKTVRR